MTNEDLIIQKLVSIEDKLETFATKEELAQLEDRLMTQLDRQTVILQRLDQEQVFTKSKIDRIENDVDRLKVHTQFSA